MICRGMKIKTKPKKLDFRVSEHDHALITNAASADGKTVTELVIGPAVRAAKRILKKESKT